MTLRTLGYGATYDKYERKPSLTGEDESLALELSKFEEDDHVPSPDEVASPTNDNKRKQVVNTEL